MKNFSKPGPCSKKEEPNRLSSPLPGAPRSAPGLAGAPERSPYFGPFYRGDACGALRATRMSQSSWSRTYGSSKEGYTPEDEFTWEED